MELSARRERTTGGRKRCAALGVAAMLAAAMLTGCGSKAGPTASSPTSASPTGPTSSPTATPTPTATHPSGRNPAMTDAEALLRMTDPQTGEKWFGKPRPIATPKWAASSPDYGDDWAHWYELGTRADASILGAVNGWDELSLIVERHPDGHAVQIDHPSPNEPRPGSDAPPELGIPHDTTTYYDSFAQPAQLALASGTPLLVAASYGLIGRQITATATSSAGTYGAFEAVRYDSTPTFAWSDPPPAGLTFAKWDYLLRTPWGSEVVLTYAPFVGYDSVKWSAGSPYTPSDQPGPTDLFDSSCGGAPLAPVIVVRGLTDRDWVAAGTTARGETIYLAAPGNPLIDPIYRAYADIKASYGNAVVTRDEWIGDRGLVAFKTPSTGSWVVYLDAGLSGRAWC